MPSLNHPVHLSTLPGRACSAKEPGSSKPKPINQFEVRAIRGWFFGVGVGATASSCHTHTH